MRRNDERISRAELQNGPSTDAEVATPRKNEVDRGGIEWRISETPAMLDLTHGAGVETNCQCRQKSVERVSGHGFRFESIGPWVNHWICPRFQERTPFPAFTP